MHPWTLALALGVLTATGAFAPVPPFPPFAVAFEEGVGHRMRITRSWSMFLSSVRQAQYLVV